jgi:hypothetical protein
MDLAEIKQRALAAREFSVQVAEGSRVIRLRVPTEHEITLATRRAGFHLEMDQTAGMLVLERSLSVLGVVGWSGVKVRDVLPDGSDEDLPWETGATELLLDAQPGWATEIYAALLARLVERKQARDTAEKNLSA